MWGLVALVGIALGSALTMAYGIRFIWGAFATKKDADGRPAARHRVAGSAHRIPRRARRARGPHGRRRPRRAAPRHGVRALRRHGAGVDARGRAARRDLPPRPLARARARPPHLAHHAPARRGDLLAHAGDGLGHASPGCCASPPPTPTTSRCKGVDRLSVLTTTFTQRGSLPVYVGTIFVVLVAAEATALVAGGEWIANLDPWQTPMQLVVAPLMIAAGIFAVRATKRYTGVVLVSVTGVGMVLLFATSGAPDLALTQVLVETVTLVAFALVLRRLPARMGEHNASVWPHRPRGARHRRRRDDGARRDRRHRGAGRRSHLRPVPAARVRAGSRPQRRERRPGRPARLGHDGRALGAHPRRDGRGLARVRDRTARAAWRRRRSRVPKTKSRTTRRRPLVETDRRRAPGDLGQQRQPPGVAARRAADEAREPLDHPRGDRARALPHDHRRVDLPALRRPQPAGRRIRGRARRGHGARDALHRRRPLRARAWRRRATPDAAGGRDDDRRRAARSCRCSSGRRR